MTGLTGAEISAGDVTYRLGHPLGTGSTATTFIATRRGAEGDLSVVVKVTLPAVLNAAGAAAALAIRKEAVSLGRLSSVASPNPFVIRLLDVGEIDLEGGGARTALPFIALEYVHGGEGGTTLTARVERTIAETGHAFDLRRIERAIRALTSGLGAIHAMRVIHRDLSPDHVLCCGRGDDEILKIAEFGFARALGMKETFGSVKLGRPGYAAPEQNGDERSKVGPWSDVYALAATLYFTMTGREYAKSIDPLAAFRGERNSYRSMLIDSPALHPELRSRTEACHAIERVLADAMAQNPDRRPPSAEVLGSRLLGAIQLGARVLAPRSAISSFAPRSKPPSSPREGESFRWSVAARPRSDLAVRSVAWSGDGRALTATDRGLAFWDATRWTEAARQSTGLARWVRSMGAGQWLVGGDGPILQRFDGTSLVDVLEAPLPADPTLGPLRSQHASGDIEDLAAFVFAPDRGQPMLYGLCGGRWLAPLSLDVDVVTALARIGDRRWLVAGRARDGGGWLGVYEPLSFRVERLPTNAAPTFLGAAGLPERGVGLACGLGGSVAWFDGTQLVPTGPLHESVPLSAAAFEGDARVWVGGAGAMFCARAGQSAWRLAWSDRRFQAPFASIYADDGRILAMSVDGGVVEGRLE
ncbi:MAG: serine/threonine-protein kinase [Polyangiales bacterium]